MRSVCLLLDESLLTGLSWVGLKTWLPSNYERETRIFVVVSLDQGLGWHQLFNN